MWLRLRVEGCFTNSLTQSNSIKLHCIHSLVSSFQLYNERPGKSPASFPGHSHILSHSCEEKPTVMKCPGNEAYVVLFPDPVQYLVICLWEMLLIYLWPYSSTVVFPVLCWRKVLPHCPGFWWFITGRHHVIYADTDCSLLVYACILNVVSLMNCRNIFILQYPAIAKFSAQLRQSVFMIVNYISAGFVKQRLCTISWC